MSVLTLNDDGQLVVYSTYEESKIVKRQGGEYCPIDRGWTFPFTIDNYEYFRSKLPNLTIYDKVEERLPEQRKIEQRLRELKVLAERNDPINFRVPGVKVALYNYQKIGVWYAITNPYGVLLADQMGLGKSVEAIATACYKKHVEGARRCLIVVPASLKWNWPLEIEKFTDERYVVIDGTPDERIQQWNSKRAFFFVVNYELILEDLFGGKTITIKEGDDEAKKARKRKQKEKAKKRAAQLRDIKRRVWDCMIIDEAQAIESHSSKRTSNVKSLQAAYKMALTGTPMDGRLEHLHSVMGFVVPGLFQAKTRFLQQHADFDFWGRVTKYKKIGRVQKKIAPFFLRRLKKDVLKELPDKVYENRVIMLSSEEQKIYKELAKRGHEVTEDASALVACLRCKQFCDHPALIDIDTKTSSKMLAFLDVLKELVFENGNKVLVFTQYTSMAEIIVEELKKVGYKFMYLCGDTPKKERAAMQERFNSDPTIDLMLGTEAMSTGLNFTSASYVINYDDNWSPAIMDQRADRAHRIGQKDTVTVVNFICKNTIEERIRSVLYEKAAVSSEVLGDETDEMVLKRLGPKDIAKLL